VTKLIAAVHESVPGTFRTCHDVRVESAFADKAEVGLRSRAFSHSLDPKRTLANFAARPRTGNWRDHLQPRYGADYGCGPDKFISRSARNTLP
jgi:hypothetical protein